MNSMDPNRFAELFTSVLGLGFLLVGLLIGIAIILFLKSCYDRIPHEHRKLEPALVWLLLIPLFNLVWMFFVYVRLAKSFQGAYAGRGGTEGDCGEKLALWYCISVCCTVIPLVNCVAAPAALVLLVVVLIRFGGLKNGLASPPAAGSGPAPGAWGST